MKNILKDKMSLVELIGLFNGAIGVTLVLFILGGMV